MTDLDELKPGEIRFHQASPPPLPPGDYTVKVTQELKGAKEGRQTAERQPFSASYPAKASFTVAGPRFFLKPTEVYSVYPPAGQFGPFDDALPHIVFTRRTLPWERTIDGGRQDVDAPVPWMALLLLGRNDFEGGELPKIASRKVADLLSPPDAIQGPQGLTLEGGQTDKDLCNTIDLPAQLFAEIAPTAADLPFLAHVREVNTGGKETLSLEQDGWFTVVLGNRLPATSGNKDPKAEGEQNLVCLVSLEGFAGLLPEVGSDGEVSPSTDDKAEVRLAVLASWRFTCHGNNDFKVRMDRLEDKQLLSLPHGQDKAAELQGDDPGSKAVRGAFERGYAGLNHTTRLGEKTVSWYRGPLVPLKMDPRSPYAFIPCADEALRYDPENGLFAVEYASAFELGRMLALQNRGLAGAMYAYRNRVRREERAELMRVALGEELGVSAEHPEDSIAELDWSQE